MAAVVAGVYTAPGLQSVAVAANDKCTLTSDNTDVTSTYGTQSTCEAVPLNSWTEATAEVAAKCTAVTGGADVPSLTEEATCILPAMNSWNEATAVVPAKCTLIENDSDVATLTDHSCFIQLFFCTQYIIFSK